MIIKESYIILDQLVLYAYHGVMPQENIVGNEYRINLRLKVDFSSAAKTDEVAQTVNYAEVYKSVKDEMDISSKLLEHVAYRICNRLFTDFCAIQEIEIKLVKRNPPMGADVDASAVELVCSR